jgi:hypothetical protein
LHFAVIDGRALEFFAGAERSLDARSALDVFEPRPHERRALARLDVQKLDHRPKLTLDDDGDAVAKIVRRNHNGRIR